jgi:DNA polymerase-3 subunit alpha
MKQIETKIPFVGLHAHSVAGSVFDGFGYPQEHMDFAYENGMSALALTDHGNMNGLSYQVLHAKKMKKEGKNFKPIFGVEAYFVPSIDEWKQEYERVKADKKKAKKEIIETDKVSAEDESASKSKSKNKINARRHLVLVALNQKGLNNIYKLVSDSHQGDNFYRYPRLDYDLLKKYGEGVMASSACLGGVYAGDYWENKDQGSEAVLDAMRTTTRRMQDALGDRWFGELQWNNVPAQHELNQYVIKIHDEFGIDLISTADSHYPSPESFKDRELYKRLGWLGKTNKPEWLTSELPIDVDELGMELYPKNGDQMWESYKKYSAECNVDYEDDMIYDSIVKTHWIAHELIEDFMPDDKVRLPEFVVPDGATATEALTKACIAGLRTRDLHENKEYIKRLRHEMGVIDDRGFSKYFLTMRAIADKANENMLSGPGRGSAAGSLVAYVLGITQVDPIKHGLLFSRFLRSDAKDYPDIDYDVSDAFGLKEILADAWGETTVVPISNYNTLQLRSLIKDIGKFYGVEFAEVNNVTNVMVREATPKAKAKHGIKAGVYVPTFEEVMEYSDSLQKFLYKYPDIKTHVEALVGQVRSTSRHAGGVVVGEDLDKHMPLICSKGVVQTPWSEGQNVRHLEPLGFIKFDLLGLTTLEMIQSAVGHVLKRYHGNENPSYKDIKEYYDNNLHPDIIDLDDQKVYKNIFHKGKFAGIFQFTNEGAQKFCKKAKPNNIIDISAITSIYRPGPLSAGVAKDYISKKKNPDDIIYPHRIVKDHTEETAGFLIFQEQIAILAHKLGKNISLDDGNKLRKLLTKKGTGEVSEEKDKLQHRFILGCMEKKIDRATAERMWQNFEYFSGYGFNKSHAVSYSILSYQCAYLLNYFPECWMAAFLDKEPETRKEAAIGLARKHGFEIQGIDVNTSTAQWELTKDGKTLIQPFSSIKGLGDKAIEQIISNRPFTSVEELLFNEEVVYSKLNKRALDALCRSGALDSIIDERFTGCKHFWMACIQDRPKSLKRMRENIELYSPEKDFSREEKIDYVSSLTGLFPFELVMTENILESIDRWKVPPIAKWDKKLGVAWFIPRERISKKTKNGKTYWILKVIDDTSTMTTIRCWGIKDHDRGIIQLNRPYAAKLDHNEDWGFSTRSIWRSFKMLG